MNDRRPPASRVAARHGWRMILATALMAGAAWLATSSALRALAQDAAQPGAAPPAAPAQESPPAGAGESNEAEEETRRAPPPTLADDESPEFRESADNNISFPIDI